MVIVRRKGNREYQHSYIHLYEAYLDMANYRGKQCYPVIGCHSKIPFPLKLLTHIAAILTGTYGPWQDYKKGILGRDTPDADDPETRMLGDYSF